MSADPDQTIHSEDRDDDWLALPPRSEWEILWEHDDLFLNRVWVGYVGRNDEADPFLAWLRGRGYDGTPYIKRTDAEAALLARVEKEIAGG